MTGLAIARRGALSGVVLLMAAAPALAQAAAQPAKIDAADTAWMISATGLVLMMSIPGLALFYSGMVRKKNVLATWRRRSPRWRSARSSG
jgi:Amt family ammonium transporter